MSDADYLPENTSVTRRYEAVIHMPYQRRRLPIPA